MVDEINNTKKKNKKKIVIFSFIGLFFLSILVGGFIFYQKNIKHTKILDEEEDMVVSEKNKNDKFTDLKYEFFPLGKYTTNLVEPDRFIQVELFLQYKTTSSKIPDILKSYQPAIQHKIIMILTTQKTSNVLTNEGKRKLAKDIETSIKEVLDKEYLAEIKIQEVLYNNFIVQ